MASSNVIFKPSDVMEMQEAHKKLSLAAKQKVLQDWGVDALLESVMNPFAERRIGIAEPRAGIKADFKEGKQTSLGGLAVRPTSRGTPQWREWTVARKSSAVPATRRRSGLSAWGSTRLSGSHT